MLGPSAVSKIFEDMVLTEISDLRNKEGMQSVKVKKPSQNGNQPDEIDIELSEPVDESKTKARPRTNLKMKFMTGNRANILLWTKLKTARANSYPVVRKSSHYGDPSPRLSWDLFKKQKIRTGAGVSPLTSRRGERKMPHARRTTASSLRAGSMAVGSTESDTGD